MRQSLSCSQISSCLPGLTSSFHFNFPFFLLFFFKFRCPFQLRFSRGSYHERFSKRVLLAFIPCFSKSPEPKVPVKKVSDFLASHYFNLCFFFCFMESFKVVAWLFSFFLCNLVPVVVEGTDSLLSPKGVNYEGLTFTRFPFS